MDDKIVILYSGGADSRLMLEFAKKLNKTIHCLMIDYGQLHKKELEFATNQLDNQKYYLTYSTVKIDLDIDSGLTGTGVKNGTGVVHEMHVPGRNSIFLSIAFSKAESIGASSIWIGCDWSDRLALFPDCYQEYLVSINETFKHAGPKPIRVEAPILGLTKEMVLGLLSNFGIDEAELHSGYGNL